MEPRWLKQAQAQCIEKQPEVETLFPTPVGWTREAFAASALRGIRYLDLYREEAQKAVEQQKLKPIRRLWRLLCPQCHRQLSRHRQELWEGYTLLCPTGHYEWVEIKNEKEER